jgi:hypothetical protein
MTPDTAASPTWQSLVAVWDEHQKTRHRELADALIEIGFSESTAGLLAFDRVTHEAICPMLGWALGDSGREPRT